MTGSMSLYLLRFLLGVAEAGFFPGVAFYLGTWFPSAYRTRMIAWFMVAVPISSVVAGPVSGLLLQMDGICGPVRLEMAVPARRAAGRRARSGDAEGARRSARRRRPGSADAEREGRERSHRRRAARAGSAASRRGAQGSCAC